MIPAPSLGPALAPTVSRKEIGTRHKTETMNVPALRYKTFCAPIVAIPSPLIAGPTRSPILAVPWINALAAVSCVRDTMSGTADAKAGPKIVDTIDVANTDR